MIMRRIIAAFAVPLHIIVSLIALAPEAHAQADIDLRQVLQGSLGQLNPISAAIGPLIDRAIASGDSALQRRLEQLNGIVQSAIFNIDQVLKSNIERLDNAAKQRIAQAVQGATVLIMQAEGALQQGLAQLDAYLAANIDRLQMAAANAVATLPIRTDPLLSVGPTGIATVKHQGNYTEVMISGSSLHKRGVDPRAVLVDANNAVHPVEVASASMGLIQLRVPNRLLSDQVSPTSYIVRLQVLRGRTIFGRNDWATPSFPLRICGALRAYTASVNSVATGDVWSRRVICHPQSHGRVKNHDCGFYIENNERNRNKAIDVCPYGTDGYEVDTDPAPNTVNGLTVSAEGGDNDHSLTRHPNGCVKMYAGWNNDRGSHEWIGGVYIRQKRRLSAQPCGAPQELSSPLSYAVPTTFQINRSALLAACLEPGLSATPVVASTVTFRTVDGSRPPEIVSLTDNVQKTALSGLASAISDSNGLISISLKSECRFHYDFRVQQ